jgi:diguanylate cyclase (GGDEF)-like protein
LAETAHLATHDALTGLPNRMLFQDRLRQAVAWSRRESMSAAVFCLDLDDFKRVNDTLGHATGDGLLIEVGTRLRTCLRETDTLARLGGDEFAIIQMSVHHPADTERLAQRIVEAIATSFDIGGRSITIGTSIGVAVRSDAALACLPIDPAALLQEAEIAQYRAKEEGGGTYRFFEAEMNVSLNRRRTLENDMRMALKRREFRLHYQPQIDLADDRIRGAEALIRWWHPSRGNVPPEEFIPVAEQTGLIWEIGAWVLEEACRQAAQWPQLDCMAINISPVQFRRPGFVDLVQHTLAEAGVDPARIELEITEGGADDRYGRNTEHSRAPAPDGDLHRDG